MIYNFPLYTRKSHRNIKYLECLVGLTWKQKDETTHPYCKRITHCSADTAVYLIMQYALFLGSIFSKAAVNE